MKKLLIIFIVLSILFITGCNKEIINDNKIKESDNMSNINVIIDNKKYVLKLENNETVSEFIKLLPQEYNMNELNGNEKYVYLDSNLPTNSSIPSKINKGDVMLFGNNCLVIFYESFTTSYSYTKIGHIDDLPDLGKNSVTVKFEFNDILYNRGV